MKCIQLYILVLFILLGCSNEHKTVTIHMIGDSTMSDKKKEVYPETGWGQVLQEYFDDAVIIKNHAVNGRSSKSFIEEGRWQKVLDMIEEGDYVFIQFGHNDEKEHDLTRYTTPYGSYKANLERFISESRAKGAMPILFTSIVRRKFDNNGQLQETHGDYPDAVRMVANEQDVPLIDLQNLTKTWINNLGDENSKEMFLWTEPDANFPEGRQDNTHLSEQGARIVAFLALEECKRQDLAFVEHLK